MNQKLKAPIVIFCYRRKIDDLLHSLLQNQEAQFSELYIFSDGFKNKNDRVDVDNVRKSLRNISGFKSIEIVESSKNRGLAASIISGVTSVLNKHDNIIVLEDDLIVSKYFLSFMNEALDFYEARRDIWSISGYSPPMNCLKDYKNDVFLSVRSSSWGWATWSSRWNNIDWEIKDFATLKNSKEQIANFNVGGNDMFNMHELQYLGKIDSWAIRWCNAQFKNNSYSVVPKLSLISNEGFSDNLGTHNSGDDRRWSVNFIDRKPVLQNVQPEKKIIKCFQKYHNLKLFTRIGYFLKKRGGYKFAKNIIRRIRSC